MSLNPLRSIPSVNEVLENPLLRGLLERLNRNVVVSTVRNVLDEVRHEVQTAATEKTLPSVAELAERIARRAMESGPPGFVPVINATGKLFPLGLGRAPLAADARKDMEAAARDYAAVDLNLVTGQASPRLAAAEWLLRDLTGAEAALVVASEAGALCLTLAALCGGREVIVARNELADLGEGLHVPELLAAAGAISREAGAANRVGPDDFEAAAGPACAALLAVRQASYSLAGNVQRISLAEIVEIGRRRSLPVVQVLHDAALIDLSGMGLAASAPVSESLRAGADVVIFGGDRLVGGPACGIIVGRRSLLQTIQRHPLARAMQADMLTLAGLGATLRLYCDPERARLEIPLLSLLSTGVDNLKNRAERLAPQIAATPRVAQAQPVASSTVLGDRFLGQQEMPTWIIQVTPKGVSPERLAADLRVGNPPVVGVVAGEQVVLDLRSVFPRQDYELVDAFSEGHGSPE